MAQLILRVHIVNPKISCTTLKSLSLTEPHRAMNPQFLPDESHPATFSLSQASCAPPGPYLLGFSCLSAWTHSNKTIASSHTLLLQQSQPPRHLLFLFDNEREPRVTTCQVASSSLDKVYVANKLKSVCQLCAWLFCTV
jgi:hypothetical protein